MQTAVRNIERRVRRRAIRPAPVVAVPPPPLTLLTIGLEPPALFPGARSVRVLSELSEGAACCRVLDLVASRTAKGGYVVVVYPTWLPAAEQARLATVRAALGSTRFVLVPTALPPLAASVLVSVAAAASRRLPHPGSLVPALSPLASRLVAVARLRGVARLRQPKPSPLRSALEPHGVVVAGEADGAWLKHWLGTAYGCLPTTAIEVPRRSRAHWGVSHAVEAVAYPLAVDDLAVRLAQRLEVHRCAWCDEAIASRPCPFCRIGAPPRDREVDS